MSANDARRRYNMYHRRYHRYIAPAGERIIHQTYIDELLENDDQTLQLKLSSFHANAMNHNTLLNAMKNNPKVKTVRMDGFFVDKLSPSCQKLLWEVIGGLPNMEALHLYHFCETTSRLSSCALNAVLGRANRLTELYIHDVVLSTSDGDYISLEHLSALKIIAITYLHRNENDDLHPLIAMCLTAPNLQELALRMARPQQESLLSCNTLDLLAQSKLSRLQLREIVHSNDPLLSHLMQHLSQGTTPLSRTLKELVLFTEHHLSYAGCVSIGKMLQSNTELRRLDLWGSTVDEDGLVFVAHSLESNRTLTNLWMAHETGSVRAQKAFMDLLREHNFCLLSIDLRHWKEEFLTPVKFYLSLNMRQIRSLLLHVNATEEEILDRLFRCRNGVDYSFHLLRCNPSFMS